jgi:glucan-binding YG repeat protein
MARTTKASSGSQSNLSSDNITLKQGVKKLSEENKKLLQQVTKAERTQTELEALQKKVKEMVQQMDTKETSHAADIKDLETRITKLTKENKSVLAQLADAESSRNKAKAELDREKKSFEESKKTLQDQNKANQEKSSNTIKQLQTQIAKPMGHTNGTPQAPIIRYVVKQRQPDFFQWVSEAPYWMHALLCLLITLLLFGNASAWVVRNAWVSANDPAMEYLSSMRYFQNPSSFRTWFESMMGFERTWLG